MNYTRTSTVRTMLVAYTAGLAPTGGMCDKDHSCVIVEHYGLQSGFTVAHETGHRCMTLRVHVLMLKRIFLARGGHDITELH